VKPSRRFAAGLALWAGTALWLFGLPAAAAPCSGLVGVRIVLSSDPVDPQVFLWDSRERLAAYATGEWGNTRAIFAHTVLADPGTQAQVIACYAGVSKAEDTLGVKVMTGPYRGRYVWVLSNDAHPAHGGGSGGAHDAGAPNPSPPQSANTR
jgi:hypothetical protein